MCFDPMSAKDTEVGVACHGPPVDAQGKRRALVPGVEYRFAMLVVFVLHTFDPPARIGKTRLGIAQSVGQNGISSAQKAAQNSVGKPPRRTLPRPRRGV